MYCSSTYALFTRSVRRTVISLFVPVVSSRAEDAHAFAHKLVVIGACDAHALQEFVVDCLVWNPRFLWCVMKMVSNPSKL